MSVKAVSRNPVGRAWPEVPVGLHRDQPYKYEKLPPDAFRFAYLLPGAIDDDEIRIRLETRELDREDESTFPQWEALSWLWGAYGDFRNISVNGQAFKVTRNLFIALRHLRPPERANARCIWVDALCIDQENLDERGAQISQMAFLFHKAKRVIAWLGEGDPSSEIVIKLAKSLHDFEHGRLTSCDENRMYILALTFGVPRVKADLSNSIFHYWNIHKYENWNYIDRVAGKTLFRRSWVLQECALATDLLVQCGTDTIQWDALFRAVSLRHTCDSRARDSPTPAEGWSAMQAIETLRQLIATKQRPPDLLELLWACRNYQSTDARDRIFALLGVTNLLYGHGPELQLGFGIDYFKPTEGIFKLFTLSMIHKYGDLRVLATKRPNRVYDDRGLGSWCPDWSLVDSGVSLLYRRRQWSQDTVSYNASGRSRPKLGKVEPDGAAIESLVLQGFILDTIAAVRYSSHFESDNTRLYDWHHWAVWPEEREWTDTPQSRAPINAKRQDAFWRTVIADADANGNRHPIYLRSQFLTWYNKIVDGFKTSNDLNVETSDHDEYKDFLHRMRQVTSGRCLFETSNYGLLGIGDEDHSAEKGGPQLRPGDIIATLYGGRLPVMLREVRNEESGSISYKLIGDAFCYIHGAVDGEMMGFLNEPQKQNFNII